MSTPVPRNIAVVGAGITGLWQAVSLARAGHSVTLYELEADTVRPASWYAGGMLAPFCEGETAEPVVGTLGQRALSLWQELYPDVTVAGSLVVAGGRDRAELQRFARMTDTGAPQTQEQLDRLEPDLEGRFRHGLFFETEAHLSPRAAMDFLRTDAANRNVQFRTTSSDVLPSGDWVIDCRGLGARDDLQDLRGVRGEMAILKTSDVSFSRPIRLLHPRFPLYVVPWGDDRFMVGATVVEREDAGPISVRGGLELLGHAYALHPAFAEAEIEELAAGVRPAFPDNTPKIVVNGYHLYINGMYRHGFLTAPALAELVVGYIETGVTHPEVFRGNCGERHAAKDGRTNPA